MSPASARVTRCDSLSRQFGIGARPKSDADGAYGRVRVGTVFAFGNGGMTPLSRHTYSVLVVDDDPSVLECYRKVLERAGYRARIESDPVKVLEANGELSGVDLMVIDYKMPGMDGLTLLAELRHREFRARCVLISAYLNDTVRQQARLLGVDLILEKPVDVSALRGAIAELLPTRIGEPARASS